ncbi:Protein of unknown function [Propionibacterium freudenreichii]|nr:Protein of unknown function [Propionibacterium freudenreichii]
MTRKAER